MDGRGIFKIPEPSNVLANVSDFRGNMLQGWGLYNDGNVCGLVSLFLAFHRMVIVEYLIDPSLIFNDNNLPDYPLCMLIYILRAIPSQRAFSVQNFIRCWNASGKVPALHPNEDIYVLAEGLISQLPLIPRANGLPPIFTRFLLQMDCQLCGNNQLMETWDGKSFLTVPSLQVPRAPQRVSVTTLLNNFIMERRRSRCNICNTLNDNLSMEVQKGIFTVVNMKRQPEYGDNVATKVLTKLEIEPESNQSRKLTQKLISVVNHVGNLHGGHWLSYHLCQQSWYRNDDAQCVIFSHHPFNTVDAISESSNLLSYLNKDF